MEAGRGVVLAASLLSLSGAVEAQSRELVAQADAACARGEHEAAIALLTAELRGEPAPSIAGRLGLSEAALGRREAARAHLAAALRAENDRWVRAHHRELLDALVSVSGDAPAPAAPPLGPTPAPAAPPPTTPPPAPAPATPAPAPQAPFVVPNGPAPDEPLIEGTRPGFGDGRFPQELTDRFRRDPASVETPRRSTPWSVEAHRAFRLRLGGGAAVWLPYQEYNRCSSAGCDADTAIPHYTLGLGLLAVGRQLFSAELFSDVSIGRGVVGAVDRIIMRGYEPTYAKMTVGEWRVGVTLRVGGARFPAYAAFGPVFGLYFVRKNDYELESSGSGPNAYVNYRGREPLFGGTAEVGLMLGGRRTWSLALRSYIGLPPFLVDVVLGIPLAGWSRTRELPE